MRLAWERGKLQRIRWERVEEKVQYTLLWVVSGTGQCPFSSNSNSTGPVYLIIIV